jgi:hypothetical protein
MVLLSCTKGDGYVEQDSVVDAVLCGSLGGNVGLLIISVILVEWHPDNSAGPDLFKISSDALKTILGAVIGALSATLSNRAGKTNGEEPQQSEHKTDIRDSAIP